MNKFMHIVNICLCKIHQNVEGLIKVQTMLNKLWFDRFLLLIIYYTIIDFNEVDIRIYQPEKVIIHQGRKAEVNITFTGR